ncbi:disulfide bond formation protein B [Defluviimonas sp. WL0024]|uniref:Disulfide bond formation protein B n=1 Tax=Albidovulum salinarum TaxID=2984153 RepID=A0ABT2WYQ7_9RHOB|nr:disulfide bond formation protein B [Defluviimonas sp. WL0024]MCU9846806.1 disulfide bond formation protein B [Defluviimonas sp. WL0024]
MTRTRLILLAAGGSLALLAGAFVFQALGYAPCKLCIWQRWPHGIAVAIGGLALVTSLPWLPWLGALAALATAGIGVFHSGVELRWWPGPDTCTASGDLAGSAEDLLNQIMAAPLVRCDEVAWMFAGLSMATWNAILSFALAALWIAAARRT